MPMRSCRKESFVAKAPNSGRHCINQVYTVTYLISQLHRMSRQALDRLETLSQFDVDRKAARHKHWPCIALTLGSSDGNGGHCPRIDQRLRQEATRSTRKGIDDGQTDPKERRRVSAWAHDWKPRTSGLYPAQRDKWREWRPSTACERGKLHGQQALRGKREWARDGDGESRQRFVAV